MLCEKNLKGSIYEKSVCPTFLCPDFSVLFPTLLKRNFNENARENIDALKKERKTETDRKCAMHRKNDPFQWKIKVELMIAYSENL